MIVVDTSALMAVFLEEPEAWDFAALLFREAPAQIAAPTAFEFMMVATGAYAPQAQRRVEAEVDLLLSRVSIVPWTAQHMMIARAAFVRYGKGRGHPAQLNFGDCMSYALAKALDVPLLFKGQDFARTDIRSAL